MAVKTGETIHECDICKKQSVGSGNNIDHKGRITISNSGSQATIYEDVCIACMRNFREWLDRRRSVANAQTVKWTPPELNDDNG